MKKGAVLKAKLSDYLKARIIINQNVSKVYMEVEINNLKKTYLKV